MFSFFQILDGDVSVIWACPECSWCRQGLLWVIITTLCSPYAPSSIDCGVAEWLYIGVISFENILGVGPDWILGPQWHNTCSFKNLLSLLQLAGDCMFNCGGHYNPPKTWLYSLLTFKTYLYGFCLISKGVLRLTTICSILLLPYPVIFIICLTVTLALFFMFVFWEPNMIFPFYCL